MLPANMQQEGNVLLKGLFKETRNGCSHGPGLHMMNLH